MGNIPGLVRSCFLVTNCIWEISTVGFNFLDLLHTCRGRSIAHRYPAYSALLSKELYIHKSIVTVYSVVLYLVGYLALYLFAASPLAHWLLWFSTVIVCRFQFISLCYETDPRRLHTQFPRESLWPRVECSSSCPNYRLYLIIINNVNNTSSCNHQSGLDRLRDASAGRCLARRQTDDPWGLRIYHLQNDHH